MITNHQIDQVAYFPRDIVCASVSTLTFMYSKPRNNSPNPTRNFPKYTSRDHPLTRTIKAPIPTNMRANEPISISNHNNTMIHGTKVVPRFAPRRTQRAFASPIIPAPTNPRVIMVTTVLLCMIHVSITPVKILLKRVLVFFSRTLLRVFFPRDLIVSSKTIIPKRNIHSPPMSSQ